MCFYGHYDVQPASSGRTGGAGGWHVPPFDVTARNGFLYGRGVSDNKGPIVAFVYAVKELLDEVGGADNLPVHVTFILEGEDETGSRGFSASVEKHISSGWFQNTTCVLIANTVWIGEKVPCLTMGLRGMISLAIHVHGPQR